MAPPRRPPNKFQDRGDHAALLIEHLGIVREVLVDYKDLPLALKDRWCVARRKNGYLAVTRCSWVEGRQRTLYLSREIMDAPVHLIVDHVNRNSLDMRRNNLRLLPPALNTQNVGANRGNRTGIRGVTFENGKYRARVSLGGVIHSLGKFDSAEDAGLAASLFRSKHMPATIEDCPARKQFSAKGPRQ